MKDIPIRTLPCRVQQMERSRRDVMRMHVEAAANERLQYLAGQYIDILMRDGIRRSLSMANRAGTHDELLELHLRNYGGPFSAARFER